MEALLATFPFATSPRPLERILQWQKPGWMWPGCPVLCLMLLPWFSGSAVAEQLILNPVKGNTLYSNDLNGSNATGDLFVGRNNAGSNRRALIEFDLSAIPAGVVIDHVFPQQTVMSGVGGALLLMCTN